MGIEGKMSGLLRIDKDDEIHFSTAAEKEYPS